MFERIWNRKHAQDQTIQDSEPEKQSANAEGGLSRNQPQRMNAGPHPNPGKLIMKSPPQSLPVTKQLDMVHRLASSISPAGKGKDEALANTEDEKLVVGARIHLRGQVTKCDALIVEGHMEGSANSRMVQVAKGGTFLGEAEVETAEISGNFEGQLTVSNKLIIRSTGKVSGKIQYLGIQIELGGKISGEVQVTPDKRSAPPSQVSDRSAEPEERGTRSTTALAQPS